MTARDDQSAGVGHGQATAPTRASDAEELGDQLTAEGPRG